ncbi:MAG: hypothetical protein JWN21_2652 [Sphingomonas bacterium]|uniref:hypothetical protein n=1 Tax=Sphingomonas bacterium TaxID=1895847 RepID=UPI00261742D8|nr:hypothetical protein [Sphingomonas bacterium]MDB5697109.1 hypothetical protein [Sphingomonas bacterium]
MGFLHTLVLVDGRLDQRETMAMNVVLRVFAQELGLVRSVERRGTALRDATMRGVQGVRAALGDLFARVRSPNG